MKKIILYILLMSIVFSCKKQKDRFCPDIDSPVSWSKGVFKYDRWQLHNDGPNMFSAPNSYSLEKTCKCKIYDHEVGGIGNTYALFGYDTAFIFRWRDNCFDEIVVSARWKGATKEGMRMGDTLSKFIHLYPEFHVAGDSTVYILNFPGDEWDSYGVVTAYFTHKDPHKGKFKGLNMYYF